jgi:hypothetical protein
VSSERGFISVIGAGAIVIGILGAVAWGAWQYASFQSERADRWEASWQEQANRLRDARLHAMAAERASETAARAAQEARGRAVSYRREIEAVARSESPDDPCMALLVASLCRTNSDSLRRAAAAISRVPVPDTPGTPADPDPGKPATGGGAKGG